MSVLAIIPARGGSKRIPRKNIKSFCGKPIIAYAISSLRKSRLFDEIVVSTDDEEIARVAEEYGASVPFLRSERTATDHATTADVIVEVLEKCAEQGRYFDYLCCLYPTAALITENDLVRAYALMQNKNANAVVPVVRYSHPPQRGFTLGENGTLRRLHTEFASMRTQDLEPVYHDAGQFYFVDARAFLREETLTPANTLPYLIDVFHAQDIDAPEDWQLAEMKYMYRRQPIGKTAPSCTLLSE